MCMKVFIYNIYTYIDIYPMHMYKIFVHIISKKVKLALKKKKQLEYSIISWDNINRIELILLAAEIFPGSKQCLTSGPVGSPCCKELKNWLTSVSSSWRFCPRSI